MSRSALFSCSFPSPKAKIYLLPISSTLLLEGLVFFDSSKNSPEPTVKGHTLTAEEEEYRFDTICASSVREVVCPQVNPFIPAAIVRAKSKGITFNRIANPQLVTAAGAQAGSRNYNLRCVSAEAYRDFVHSFVGSSLVHSHVPFAPESGPGAGAHPSSS